MEIFITLRSRTISSGTERGTRTMQSTSRAGVVGLIVLWMSSAGLAQRHVEQLDGGVVAVHKGEGKVFVGWRLLAGDPADAAFNVYRAAGNAAPASLNGQPLTGPTHFDGTTADVAQANVYTARPVANGKELDARGAFTLPANAPAQPYLSIPLKTPDGYRPI